MTLRDRGKVVISLQSVIASSLLYFTEIDDVIVLNSNYYRTHGIDVAKYEVVSVLAIPFPR